MYQSYDTEVLRLGQFLSRAILATTRVMAAQGAQLNGSFPADPRSGGYEDEEGVWHEYWRAGMAVEAAPIEPR